MVDLQKEAKELGVFSVEGVGILTEKAVSAAFRAIKENNKERNEDAEWAHIKAAQKKKLEAMQESPAE
jgi:hypothetical protein